MRALLRLTFVALLLLLVPAQAWAHASLLSSAPRDGAVLEKLPSSVVLTFSEPVAGLVFGLTGADGVSRPLEAVVDGPRVVIGLPPDGGEGVQLVSWRVVSSDGHPVGGVVSLSIGAAAAAPSAAAAQFDINAAALWLITAMAYGAAFFTGGGALFAAVASVRRRRGILALAGVGLLAALASLPLYGADLLQMPVTEWTKVIPAAVGTTFGARMAGLVSALILAAASALVEARAFRIGLAAVAVSALAAGMAASGHAASAEPRWLTVSLVFVHALGIAGWVGALPALARGLMRDSDGARRELALFSAFVPMPTVLIALSGIGLTAMQLTGDLSRWRGPYVWILTVKALLLAGVAVAACYNRYTLTKPALAGDRAAALRLRQVIVGEIAAVCLVFGLVSLWRFTPPPRAYTVLVLVSDSLHLHGEPMMANVTLSGVMGAAVADVELQSTAIEAVKPRSVEVSFTSRTDPSLVIRKEAEEQRPGQWIVADLPLLEKEWDVVVAVRVSDFAVQRLEGRSLLHTSESLIVP